MELKKFNNKVKDTFDEEYDALAVKTGSRWTRLFEDEVKKVEIINIH